LDLSLSHLSITILNEDVFLSGHGDHGASEHLPFLINYVV